MAGDCTHKRRKRRIRRNVRNKTCYQAKQTEFDAFWKQQAIENKSTRFEYKSTQKELLTVSFLQRALVDGLLTLLIIHSIFFTDSFVQFQTITHF